MGLFRYTATRSLRTLTIPGATVDLEVGIRRYLMRRAPQRRITAAMGGARQVVLDRIDVFRRVETTHHTDADLPALVEFLDSVSAGETFQISPTGTAAAPGVLIDALMVSDPSLTEIGRGIYRLSFEVVTGHAASPTAPAGWSDPTGLTWDYAWDFTSAPGGTGAVPAIVGSVDLTVDAGSYTIAGALPSTIGSNGYTEGSGFAEASSSPDLALSASLPGLSASNDPVHLRIIGRADPVDTANWNFILGDISGNYLRAANNSTTNRWFSRVRSPAQIQTEETATIGDVVVFDAVARQDSGEQLDVYVNGSASSASSATAFAALGSDSFTIDTRGLEIGWVGVRRSNITQSEHDAAVANVGAP